MNILGEDRYTVYVQIIGLTESVRNINKKQQHFMSPPHLRFGRACGLTNKNFEEK